MKKQTFKCVVAILACVASIAAAKTITPVTPKQETSGEKCYLIGSAEELYGYADLVYTKYQGICAKLTDDIVVNKNVLKDPTGKSNVASDGSYSGNSSNLIPWTPIKGYDGAVQFKFYGQGHSISGLFFSSNGDGGGFIGMSGSEMNDTTIIDGLKLTDSYFKARGDVGAFVGYVARGTVVIRNSSSDNFIVGDNDVGGFVGFMDWSHVIISGSVNNGTVKNSGFSTGGFLGGATDGAVVSLLQSTNNGSVNGTTDVGGFVGWIGGDSLTIIDGLNNGNVKGNVGVGGFLGTGHSAFLVDVAVNKGLVQGITSVGGLAGHDYDGLAIHASIINSFANMGTVIGAEQIGGLSGCVSEKKITVENSTNAGRVIGNENVGGFVGVTYGGRDNDIMTFKNTTNAAPVIADTSAGGFIGAINFGIHVIFKNDHNNGGIKGAKNIGGFIGKAGTALISVEVCTNDSSVTGFVNVGGLVGLVETDTELYAENIFNEGAVSGDTAVGAFVGSTNYGMLRIENVLNEGPVTGKYAVGAIVGYLAVYEAKLLNVLYGNSALKSIGLTPAYFSSMEEEERNKILVDSSEFVPQDSVFYGYAAIALHDYKSDSTDGSIWGQDVARDSYPKLGKKVVYLPVITELNGGSLEEPFVRYVYHAKTVIPTPTREQYDFAGWFLDSTFAEDSRIDTLSERMTNKYLYLYAKWVEIPVVDTIVEDTIPEDTLPAVDTIPAVDTLPAVDTIPEDTVPEDTVPEVVVPKCIAFENGLGHYGENCYNSGLLKMEEGACYTMNPDRSNENPQWINNIATETWWWKKVPCDGVEPPADTSTCIAFENGLGHYGEHCYKSGLLNMEAGACYTMNPDRSNENPQWINNIATETWWWKKVSCDVFPDVNGGLKRAGRPSVNENVKNDSPVVVSADAVKTAKVYDILGNFLGMENFVGSIADVNLSKYAGKGAMVVRFFEGNRFVATKLISR